MKIPPLRIITPLVLFALSAFTWAQKKGDPVKDVDVSLGMKPSDSLSIAKDDLIKTWGKPTLDPTMAGFRASEFSASRGTEELVWQFDLAVPSVYTFSNRGFAADPDRQAQIGVLCHVVFDSNGKPILYAWRWRGRDFVDVGTVVRALTKGEGFPSDSKTLLFSATGAEDAAFETLDTVAERLRLLSTTPQQGNLNPNRVQMGTPVKSLTNGLENEIPWLVVGEAYAVNPLGQIEKFQGERLPAWPPPILWQEREFDLLASTAPAYPGSTVPGVDIIIKKCPCSGSFVIPTGVVGYVPRALLALKGKVNRDRLAQFTRTGK
ncbi:MAG: hypothetical protein LCH41_05795 [Armatimonadetes bacterium]|nr:hypothetical protein [Armatimonadota bacterium]